MTTNVMDATTRIKLMIGEYAVQIHSLNELIDSQKETIDNLTKQLEELQTEAAISKNPKLNK